MLFQLGDKEFKGTLAPASWSYSGNEANLAEHALINTKPRLQLTGETLEELELSFLLRADFCKPAQEIADLEKWKSEGEVLPLLLGDGTYKNDYVIKSISKKINQTFADGAIIEAEITVSLLEYVSPNKAQQRTAADRKNAAAVGDKEQISRLPSQTKTAEASAHDSLMQAQLQAQDAAEQARKAYETGQPQNYIDKLHKTISEAQKKMNEARQQINNVQSTISGAVNIVTAIQTAAAKLNGLSNILQPPISLSNLEYGIIDLQSALNGIDVSSVGFTQNIVLRKQ